MELLNRRGDQRFRNAAEDYVAFRNGLLERGEKYKRNRDAPWTSEELEARLKGSLLRDLIKQSISEPLAIDEEQTINNLIQARKVARDTKNWAESDRIRDQLKSMGIILEDRKDGTVGWHKA